MAVTIAIIVRAIVDAFISTGFKSNYLGIVGRNKIGFDL
jgi:hypothetical protein